MAGIRAGYAWGLPPKDAGDDRESGFDWAGVVVRHWLACGPRRRGKGQRVVYPCVSRCGVRTLFRADDLAAGATRTCEACRPGVAAPPPARVVPEADMAAHLNRWETTVIAVKSNLKGKHAAEDWAEYGRPLLEAAVGRVGLGLDFGWQAFVRDCHERARPKGEGVVRAKSWNPGQRRVELFIRPAHGRYAFEVDLSTGRTDVPFADVQKRITAALDPPAADATLDPPTAPPTPAAVPELVADPPAPATVLGGLNLASLEKLRDGMDVILAVGRDVASTAELKREAAARVARARAAADPLREALGAAAAVSDRARADADAAHDRAVKLALELKAATVERDRLMAEAVTQAEARDRALAAYAPARDALAAAETDLADVERIEAERVRSLAKADDLGPLLLALQRLAG